jgi:hypothetical protein
LKNNKFDFSLVGGNLTGICGNCNGHVKDDYQTKEGVDGGYADIGNSYKVLDDPPEKQQI